MPALRHSQQDHILFLVIIYQHKEAKLRSPSLKISFLFPIPLAQLCAAFKPVLIFLSRQSQLGW